MKRIAVLGSTGSIGRTTLRIARHLQDELRVVALAAKSNSELLEQQAREFQPECIALADEAQAAILRKKLPGIRVLGGPEGVAELAACSSADLVVAGMVGTAGLLPTIAAIEAGKTIALANKEVLVAAGALVTELARRKGVTLIPMDSEHSALFQCLKNEPTKAVRRLILTASGGAFRHHDDKALDTATAEDALRHPNWDMGPKITIDCSTLMNKGFEVIEAHWLFNLPLNQIDVVTHPQSIIHSMVEYIDGSILAQLGVPDMSTPIQYSLTYPNRRPGTLKPFDFMQHRVLEFGQPDLKRYPCLKLAYDAARAGGSAACYLNAANEVLVQRFIERKIGWKQIGITLEALLSRHHCEKTTSIEHVLEVDKIARRDASVA